MNPMMKVASGVALCLAAGIGIYAWWVRDAPVEARIVEARRKTLESVLETNGKVEPAEMFEVRAETEGTVEKVLVTRGEKVRAGQTLLLLETSAARLELDKAAAGLKEAQAQLALLERGGREIDRVALENERERFGRQISETGKDLEAVARLVDRGAAPRRERLDLERRLRDLEAQQAGVAARLKALVAPAELEAARARAAAAQSELHKAERSLRLAGIRAPRAGEIYSISLKPGAFLRPGDLVARLSVTAGVRVLVQVDEPELGKIRLGMPVVVKWEARPYLEWRGTVGRMPAEIVSVGARQIGEVAVDIGQEESVLAPGATVTVEIEVGRSESAIVAPREAVQRRGADDGVYVLDPENRVTWRVVTLGHSNVRETEIVRGLQEKERLAVVAASVRLEDGTRVKAAGWD
jgi:RND family efflux transporter MFP subunit